MSKKKGAIIAVIAVVAAFGGLVAYSLSLPRQNQASTEPAMNTVDSSQLKANDSGPENNGGTTVAENIVDQQPQKANGTVISNNTVIANNTIVINKPVYNNNTVIYQPVTIHLENYKTMINQQLEVENNNIATSSKPPTSGKTYSMTIHAKRIPSDGWSGRFTDDRVGMFVAVYDIKGKLIKSGFADENGLMVNGLQNSLYFVYPADCTNCNHSKNDIIFKQWQDGGKDRPKLVPAGSDVTASYALLIEKTESPPKEPTPASPDVTQTSAVPDIKLSATNATYVYGWVQINAQIVNKVQGYDDVLIKVYDPNGTLDDSFHYSDQQGFFASRQAGEGNYRIVGTYKYDKFTAKDEILYPIKFATPKFVNLVATEDNGTVRLSGLMKGGLAGENVSIAIHSPDGSVAKKFEANFSTKPIISLLIGSNDASAIFKRTGNYTFVVTHLLTGTQGNTTLFYYAGGNTTTAAISTTKISDSSGKSERPDIAASGNIIYAVWQDDTPSRREIMFAKSNNGGASFSKPVAISDSKSGGFSNTPHIAVSGNNVYVAWADYDSDQLAAVALRASNDSGKTFGTEIMLGNHTGEVPDPQVVATGNEVYVSWVAGAVEEFTGNLMLAKSADGGSTFESELVAENASGAVAAGSGGNLYLTWRHFPSGETPNNKGSTNIFEAGGDLQNVTELQNMTIYSMAASSSTVYVAGLAGDSVVLVKGSGANFTRSAIGTGLVTDVAASGNNIYVVWENDGKVFLATSMDGGKTFSNADELSSNGQSHFPSVAASSGVHVAWNDNNDILLATG